jgi:hypothetical protein
MTSKHVISIADDLEGEGANRTSGPNGLDLLSAAGRGCLLEHGHDAFTDADPQPTGPPEQRRAGDAVTDPDPQPNGQPAPGGAGHG